MNALSRITGYWRARFQARGIRPPARAIRKSRAEKQPPLSSLHWYEDQYGDMPEATGVLRGILIGAGMWAALAFIVWLSHRLA